ncbi:MAG: hypothetical protein LAO20_18185 [Acidobacteriia bacterium]|nr:hypothetical protein [Terriglobia bacterium]
MAKIIAFYIPARHRPEPRWTPEALRGKLLAFPVAPRETFVWLANGALWPLQPPAAPKTLRAANRRRPLARTAE